jgi:hypothetical protein
MVPRIVLYKSFGRYKVKRFDNLDDFVNFDIPPHYFQQIYKACAIATLRFPRGIVDGFIELIGEDFHDSKEASFGECEGAIREREEDQES